MRVRAGNEPHQDAAFVGFTSATGSGYGNHDLPSWEYRGSYAPVVGVPEPSSVLMMAAGSAGLLAYARVRRSSRRAG